MGQYFLDTQYILVYIFSLKIFSFNCMKKASTFDQFQKFQTNLHSGQKKTQGANINVFWGDCVSKYYHKLISDLNKKKCV